MLTITGSNIRLQAIWAVSLVIADGHLIFLRGMSGYVWVNMLTWLFTLRAKETFVSYENYNAVNAFAQ